MTLDVGVLLHAAETLSSELDPDRLIEKLMRLCVDAAAAERAVLLLDEQGLVVRAEAGADGGVTLKQSRLDGSARLPARLLEQVLKSSEPFVASDLSKDPRFGADAGVRSAMAVPLRTASHAIGVLYFENSAINAERVQIFRLLSTGMAIALDNAQLHHNLRNEVRLRADRDRYLRMIFRQMPSTVWATDHELVLTYVAGSVRGDSGLDATQLLGTSVYDFVGTRDVTDPAIAHHLAALAGARHTFEYRMFDRWYEVQIEPLKDGGAIIGCVGSAFDVTERRATREQLSRDEARLAEAQRVAHVGSFEWDVATNAVTWTAELHRIYALEPGRFEGTFQAFLSRVHPDDLDHTRAVVFDALRERKPFVYDHRVVRPDGSARVLHTRGDVIVDAAGNPLRMVGTCWDVTELTEATSERERSLSLLQATVEATADGLFVTNLNGTITLMNRRLKAQWGLPQAPVALDQKNVLETMLHQVEDPEGFRAGMVELHGQNQTESIDVVRLNDGRVFERYSRPQRIGDTVVGRVWSFRDVSERERLLRRAVFLADATRLLASLDLDRALDGVAHLAVPYLGDGCAIDLFGDGAPRRLLAVSRDPARPISPEVHPAVLAGHATIYNLSSISYLGVPLVVKGRVAGAITLAAAPQRRYSPADLELAEELARRSALSIESSFLFQRAQDAVRARDEFLSIASHEIRGPVTALHLAVQLLQAERITGAARPRAFGIIEREDRRLGRFVDELLDLTRIRTGRLHFDLAEVDLGQIARDASSRLDHELTRSGSPLSLTIEGDAHGVWDAFRADQIVTNLLSNAIKFGLGKPIEVRISTHDGHAQLAVTDHGIGIAPDARERLFSPFERAVSTRHYGGLGLGLYIVKTIAEGLGGTVSLKSALGGGSTFTVDLPRERRPS
jgi:PAS domain S-box-containing protein